MIVINKNITISGENKKIEFDLPDLPEGEYHVRLTIEEANKITTKDDYALENWSSGINLNPLPAFRREEMY